MKNENYNESVPLSNWTTGVGYNSGYKFLLNVNSDKYCVYKNETWYGVGFHVTFHGRNMFPAECDTEGTVFVSPGYQYNIVLKPIHYIRKTSHLGKCVWHYPLYMFPKQDYVKKLCHVQCLMDQLWKICSCFATQFAPLQKAFGKHYGVNESRIPLCWTEDKMECYTEYRAKFSAENHCPQCKEHCDEMMYNYEVTAVKLSHNSFFLKDHLKKLNATSEKQFVENFLLLNIFFQSNSLNIIVDSQVFTLKDLFVYIGNNIGLFLGMSFISFYDFIHHFLIAVHVKIKKIMKGKKMRFVRLREMKIMKNKKKNEKIHLRFRNISVCPTALTTPV